MAKKLPAYGKALMEMRKRGKVPSNSVVVAFDFKIGKLFQRIVVNPGESPANWEFRFLAGLDVIISYGDEHAHLVRALAEEILKNKPSMLQAFSLFNSKTHILKHSDGRIFL